MKSNRFWNFSENENKERTLYLSGVIADESFLDDNITPKQFKEELLKDDKDITLWINSIGGDVLLAIQIYNMLKEYKGKVTVKIDALAASAASIVAMAGDKIYVSPLSIIMVHNPETLAVGNKYDMEKAGEMLDEIKEAIINAYECKTKLARNQIAEFMDNETWFSAKKAVEFGFADGILYEEDEEKNHIKDVEKENMKETNK
ncbi:MAG: Clp protease ClpP [Oscillospiraceae bacterium]|nr:Clp protease ClpP [Oscillospiraceae bacterium]